MPIKPLVLKGLSKAAKEYLKRNEKAKIKHKVSNIYDKNTGEYKGFAVKSEKSGKTLKIFSEQPDKIKSIKDYKPKTKF
tara:strand:+ start:103 stop:339 length:237 start_codon:yes stop_codon:yes gene_type:complete